MLRVVSITDHFGRDRIDPGRWTHQARYYTDDRGHAWRLLPGRRRWGGEAPPAPGAFYSADSALQQLRYLRAWYREPQQTRETNRLAHLARWRIVRATADRGHERVERFDLAELAPLPEAGPGVWPPSDLRPAGHAGWTLDDHTAAAVEEEAAHRARAERWEHARRRESHHGDHDWRDRPDLLRIVRPSRATRTASAHYVERAGRWRRVDDPAGYWHRRDTVEVVLRLRDPRLAVAVYKRRGRVGTFHERRGCRVWYGYDHVPERRPGTAVPSGGATGGGGGRHRAVRAPAQEAAAIRALLDRARRDLAGDVRAEADRRRRGRTPSTTRAQLALFE